MENTHLIDEKYLFDSCFGEFRVVSNITCEEFGNAIGVSRQQISNFGTGKTPISIPNYIALRSVIDYWIETGKIQGLALKFYHMLFDPYGDNNWFGRLMAKNEQS